MVKLCALSLYVVVSALVHVLGPLVIACVVVILVLIVPFA